MTALEKVIRPGETVQTPFGTGYYTYIAPHVDNNEEPDIVTLTIKASTSTQTTTTTGLTKSLKHKLNHDNIEVNRDEKKITIKNPDDEEQKVTFGVPKKITTKDSTGATPNQTTYYSTPASDPSGSGSDPSGQQMKSAIDNYYEDKAADLQKQDSGVEINGAKAPNGVTYTGGGFIVNP